MIHNLKILSEYFNLIKERKKNFEVRQNDRNFKIGDVLILEEYDLENEKYTGREIVVDVDYILYGGKFGIDKSYCVMSINIKRMKLELI